MRPAEFYRAQENGAALCLLCPHGCVIAEGKAGRCQARRNQGGVLYAASYGAVTALSLDPIEKKPLSRFHPGAKILSLGSFGCNLRCGFCQNSAISMTQAPFRLYSPEDIAAAALELAERGNIGVAYTYNEPLIGYEFITDTARLIHAQGQKNVLVTNGYLNQEPLKKLLPLIDAMNIDLKAFSPNFYRQVGGGLAEVQSTIQTAAAHCHVEITTLIIPGKNDTENEMRALSQWLSAIDATIPLHISRFFPAYQWRDIPPTPARAIYRLADIAKESLRHVYPGNI